MEFLSVICFINIQEQVFSNCENKNSQFNAKTVVMQAAMWYDIYKVLSLVEESVLPFAAVRVGGEDVSFI